MGVGCHVPEWQESQEGGHGGAAADGTGWVEGRRGLTEGDRGSASSLSWVGSGGIGKRPSPR